MFVQTRFFAFALFRLQKCRPAESFRSYMHMTKMAAPETLALPFHLPVRIPELLCTLQKHALVSSLGLAVLNDVASSLVCQLSSVQPRLSADGGPIASRLLLARDNNIFGILARAAYRKTL